VEEFLEILEFLCGEGYNRHEDEEKSAVDEHETNT